MASFFTGMVSNGIHAHFNPYGTVFFLNQQNICNTIQTLSGHRIHDVEAMRRIPALDRRAFNFVRKCVKTIILQNIIFF